MNLDVKIFTTLIFKSYELGYAPLDEKTKNQKKNNVLSCVISRNPEVASRIKQM